MKISEYCKNIRTKKEMNVLTFSKELNCSHSYILNIESGKYNEPTALVLAKIVIIYNLKLDDFILSLDNEFTDAYLNNVKRILNKKHGTKPINSIENVIRKINNEYLIPNGYSEARYYKKNEYYCFKKNINCFLLILDEKSTIMTEKDKNELVQLLANIVFRISTNSFKINNNHKKHEIIIVTSSKKILEFIKQTLGDTSFALRKDYKLGIALSRPKRPIIPPYYF